MQEVELNVVLMVGVAQLAEHRVVVPVVAGSNPVTHPYLTSFFN